MLSGRYGSGHPMLWDLRGERVNNTCENYCQYPQQYLYFSIDGLANPFKNSRVKWLHFKVFNAVLV